MEILKITYNKAEETYIFEFEDCRIFIDKDGDFIGSIRGEEISDEALDRMSSAAEELFKIVSKL